MRPAIRLGQACYTFDNKLVIDPIVNAVGRFWAWFSDWLRRAIDNPIIDGIVNGVGRVTSAVGEELRYIQTGRVQNYMVIVVISVVLLMGVFLYM